MIGLLTAFWLSKPLRYALIGLALTAGYEGWKHYQRSIGAASAKAEVERKANDDARKADDVRDATAAGQLTSRVRNPYERPRR